MSPNAVVFIATEILADSMSALSAGFAFETAVKALISPIIVPNSPSSVAMLASVKFLNAVTERQLKTAGA